MHGPLAGSDAGCTLAGAPNLAIMAGRGALCPERKLKGHPPVSSRCSTPGCRSETGDGLEQPTRKPTTMQTTTERPARVACATARQLAAQERRAAKARQRVRELRQKASAEIERLIAFMDETDGYTVDEREPSLGAPEIAPTFSEYSEKYQMWFTRKGDQTRWAGGATDDREGDDGDDEPSLGFQAGDIFVGRGCEHGGSGDDREEECEDEGAQCDDEGDLSDTGIGDEDGLREQVGNSRQFSYGEVL